MQNLGTSESAMVFRGHRNLQILGVSAGTIRIMHLLTAEQHFTVTFTNKFTHTSTQRSPYSLPLSSFLRKQHCLGISHLINSKTAAISNQTEGAGEVSARVKILHV